MKTKGAETKMLRWICDVTGLNRTRNKQSLGVTDIAKKNERE